MIDTVRNRTAFFGGFDAEEQFETLTARVAELEAALLKVEFGTVTFPHFWMFRNEDGWRWVSRDSCQSSRAAFDFPGPCALDAERTLRAALAKGKVQA